MWKLGSHVEFGKLELMVECFPELLLVWLGSQVGHVELETDGLEDSLGGVKSVVLLEIWSDSLVSKNVLRHGELLLSTEESEGVGSIIRSALARINSCLDGVSERVLSVEGPHSLEMGFGSEWLWHLVWVKHHLGVQDFWSDSAEGIELGFEFNSSFFGGGVNTEIDWLFLISVSEGIEKFISVINVEMTMMSVPPWLWDLVIEES